MKLKNADKPKSPRWAVHVFVGEYGNYHIPDSVYYSVKKWRRDGWPDRRYKDGSAMFHAWVKGCEEATRNHIYGKASS